jgi:hypothetical protein
MEQDVTMATLTVIFAVRTYKVAPELMLSLVTSALVLGMKLNKIFLLKPLYATAAQRHDCSSVAAWHGGQCGFAAPSTGGTR